MKNVKGRGSEAAWLLVYIMAAWVVGHFYLHYTGGFATEFIWFPKVELTSMEDGTGTRPYVGRMLVPVIVKGLADATTPSMEGAEKAVLTSPEFNADFVHPSWMAPGHWPKDLVAFYFLTLAIFLGIGLGGRAAYGAIYGDGWKAGLAGLLLLVGVPMWAHGFSAFYDPMTVLLATWIVYAVAKSNLWLALVLFILAFINKETAVLFAPLILYGAWTRWKSGKTQDDLYRLILAGVVLVLGAALIQTYRINHFANNPGAWTENNFVDVQLGLFSRYPMTTLYEATVLAVMLWFSFAGFRQKPAILKNGTLFVFVPLAISAVAIGRVIEVRALYDAYPILGLLAIPTLYKALGIGETVTASEPEADLVMGPPSSGLGDAGPEPTSEPAPFRSA